MTDFNPYAAPQTDLNVPRDPSEIGVWRDGGFLVMTKGAELPDRCLKCGEPAEGYRLKRKLAWHPPIYYALIIVNILIYAIVAVIVQKKAVIQVPLCPRHRRRRKNLILAAWGFVLLGPAVMVGAAASRAPLSALVGIDQANTIMTIAMVLGAFMILTGAILGVIASQVVSPEKIDKTHVWLKNVAPALLDSLPPWSNLLPASGPNLDNHGMISFPKQTKSKARSGTARDDLELLADDEF